MHIAHVMFTRMFIIYIKPYSHSTAESSCHSGKENGGVI